MLFFLVSFLSFLVLLTKPLLPLKLPSWAHEMTLLSSLLLQELLHHSLHSLNNFSPLSIFPTKNPIPSPTKIAVTNQEEKKEENAAESAEMNVLDLPELALDLILEKLPPAGLSSMSDACTCLRERCRSDHLWKRHFEQKWGAIIGPAARKEWEAYFASAMDRRRTELAAKARRPFWLCLWPCSWFLRTHAVNEPTDVDADITDSVMAWYLALESGRFWFPAQVYNREQNGHVGFMLSCYDAELSYDSQTDTFHARYPPHGQRATNVEEGVKWERLRAPPVDTPAHELHASDCLHDLRPGDHIEIQWRRNKEFPYGWWYGVVGHLESCDGDEHHCRCFDSDTIVLEFNQYSLGSRWRRTVVDRKDHREEGNESDGFYGGIRKLHGKDEISTWRRLWPADVLE